MSHFTLAADLTTLREECRFVCSRETMVARYLGLPFPALAFLGEDPGQLTGLAAQLVGPGEAFYVLLNERQAALAERAFVVEQAHPEWQMLFADDSTALDPGGAVLLGPGDLEPMRGLAEDAGLMALAADPFRHGPAFGVWEAGQLVAMAATRLQIPGIWPAGRDGAGAGARGGGSAGLSDGVSDQQSGGTTLRGAGLCAAAAHVSDALPVAGRRGLEEECGWM